MKISEWMRRLKVFARRDRWQQELDEEMRLHLELRTKAYENRGLEPADAQLAAKRRFGNRLALRESARDAWVLASAESTWKDLGYSIRRLLRDRAASTAVVLTLALGIGANTAMFTLIDSVLFRPAPVSDPSSLAWVSLSEARSGRLQTLSYPAYQRFAHLRDTFTGVAAFATTPFSLGGDVPSRIQGLIVSGNYFEVLGVPASLGKMLQAADDGAPGARAVAVMSHALWTNRFGADPAIAGKRIVLNGRPFTVAGVAPKGFGGLEIEPAAVWVPFAMTDVARPGDRGLLRDANAHWLNAVGRLRPGVSHRDASAVLDVVARQMADGRDEDEALRASAKPVSGSLDPQNRSDAAPVFGLLSIVPLLVLAVSCANVGNLLLSRGLARRKELALRKALGAGRGRLVRQLLIESVLLSLVACAAGVLFSYALTAGIVRYAGIPSEISEALNPDARVLLASALLAIVAGVAFGLAPALASTSAALVPALKDADVSLHAGGRRHRLRGAFLIAQVTASFILIIVAGLFLQSVSKALAVDPGFDRRNAVVMTFEPELQGYDANGRQRLTAEILRAVTGVPGVRGAALSTSLPLTGRMYGNAVRQAGSADAPVIRANFASVSPAYFDVMGIPLLGGRAFTPRDDRASSAVAIVNDVLAARLWPGENPLGQRFLTGLEEGDGSHEVVGIVKGGKYDEFSEDPRAFFFVPDAQQPLGRLTLVARTALDPASMVEPVRAAVQRIDPDMPLFDTGTLEHAVQNAVDTQEAASSMLAVFGALVLLLAAFGLYAVTSQSVALRTREIGIRLALGANPARVLSMFVRQGVSLCAIGIAIGAAVSLASSSVLTSFLYGLRPSDAVTYLGASLLFIGVAAVASAIPARRAAAVDPLRALRQD